MIINATYFVPDNLETGVITDRREMTRSIFLFNNLFSSVKVIFSCNTMISSLLSRFPLSVQYISVVGNFFSQVIAFDNQENAFYSSRFKPGPRVSIVRPCDFRVWAPLPGRGEGGGCLSIFERRERFCKRLANTNKYKV